MIAVRFWGALGNQMFQYAAARALAEKNNTTLKFDKDLISAFDPNNTVFKVNYELNVFNIQDNVLSPHEKKIFLPIEGNLINRMYYKICRLLLGASYQRIDIYTDDFWNIKNNTCIEGRFQSEKYFKPYEDIIRKEFEFNITIPDFVKPLEQKIKASNAVGIQVRRGIIKTPFYLNIMGVMEPEYYQNGIEIITKTHKDAEIFVISDDIEWCKNNLKFDQTTTFLTDDIASNSHYVQLYLLSCCSHFIIPNSTFAWWGAWLSKNKNKIVVAPKNWFLDKSFCTEDPAPDNWIKI